MCDRVGNDMVIRNWKARLGRLWSCKEGPRVGMGTVGRNRRSCVGLYEVVKKEWGTYGLIGQTTTYFLDPKIVPFISGSIPLYLVILAPLS